MSQGDVPLWISPVALARLSVETYVKEGQIVPVPAALPPELTERAGVFVSLKKLGELRGCIGTYEPLCRNIAEEIIHNAVKSATADPRFAPVQRQELPMLTYSVDVLTRPELVESREQLDPSRYGVIVEWAGRRGLLLPDLPGVERVEQQLEIACAKARIRPTAPYLVYRFEVRRYY